MDQIRTSWSDPAHAGSRPKLIVDSYMFQPGEIVTFEAPGVSVVNVGTRQAAVHLRADGLILTDRVPIVRSEMPAATATWIAKNVLTRPYLKSVGGVKLARLCSCQYGQCGHCGLDEHDKCTTWIGWDGKPPAGPLTRLLSRRGSALVDVWGAGTACRWFCSCPTCRKTHPVQPTKKAEPCRLVSGGVMRPGDTVWLTPKTLTAPAICWKRPRAVVVTLPRQVGYVVVQVDGTEHRVHEDNIRFSNPGKRTSTSKPAPRPRPALPDGFTEEALF